MKPKGVTLRTVFAAPLIVLTCSVLCTAATVQILFGVRGKSLDITTLIWAKLLGFFAGMTVTGKGASAIDPARSYVVVANHQSHMDTVALYVTCPVPLRMLAKAELYKIPILGRAMEGLGHIKVYRDKNHKTDMNRLFGQVENLRKAGRSVMVFAEGSRSRNGSLLGFKKGAFKIAAKFGLPILPVVIDGTWAILPPKTLHIKAGKATVTYLPVIEPGDRSPETLREKTHAAISRQFYKNKSEQR